MALVRVREDGLEFNVGERYAAAKGLEVIDEPTHVGGKPRGATRTGGRPVKPRKSVDALVAEKSAKDSDAPAASVEAAPAVPADSNPATTHPKEK